MISEYANGHSGDQRPPPEEVEQLSAPQDAAVHPLKGGERHPTRDDSDEPDAVRPTLKSRSSEEPEAPVLGADCETRAGQD